MKKNIVKETGQQGDVLFKKRPAFVAGERVAVPRRNGQIILAEGEVTGHFHGIESPNATLFQIGEIRMLEVKDTVTVKHQEHKPITLSPGIYEIGGVVEYDYYKDMVQKVKD